MAHIWTHVWQIMMVTETDGGHGGHVVILLHDNDDEDVDEDEGEWR